MLIPSTIDDSLAPPGQHVASLFCQQFAPTLPTALVGRRTRGRRRPDHRHGRPVGPNFKASVLGRMILSPLDLERKFGLVGGDIMHGHMSLDQLWAARPVLGHASHRAPIKGLYMCGAGTHPGGGVSKVKPLSAPSAAIAANSATNWPAAGLISVAKKVA
jgi:phytoene dehydrogenase-like protein